MITRRKQIIWIILTLMAIVSLEIYFRCFYHHRIVALPSLEGGDYHQYPMPEETILNYRLPPYLKLQRPEAISLGTNWVFDLFTPPQITLSRNSFSAESPECVADPMAFELSFVSFHKTPYRIQFEGYVLERPEAKASYKSYNIMLNDLQRNHTFRCTVGTAIPASRISISDFRLIRIKTEEGIEIQEPVVTIFDQETESYVDIGREKKYYDNVYTIVFRSLKSGNSHVFQNIGDSITVGDVLYVLSDINLKEGQVSLRAT